MAIVPRVFFGVVFIVAGCGDDGATPPDSAPPEWRAAPAMPAPLANNSVASIELEGGCMLYTALGIDDTLTAAGITTRAYRWREGDDTWSQLPDVPGDTGRVAASSVSLRGKIYVLGGYSVGPGTTETSFDAVDVFDVSNGQWSQAAPMPIPVDDQVAVAWRDRWIVSVSGWSNSGNVAAVQVYDADTDEWAAATDFPGTPAFGHSGALVGDEIVIIDGVGSGITGFNLVNQSWVGTLDPANPTVIAWDDLGAHPGPARYRAAGGDVTETTAWFHGGTDDPYNYDGLSYDTNQPSAPLATTLEYDSQTRGFSVRAESKPTATMDHRGLPRCADRVYTVGGMVAGPTVTADVWVY
jgi:hypothetical protein